MFTLTFVMLLPDYYLLLMLVFWNVSMCQYIFVCKYMFMIIIKINDKWLE